MKKKQRDKIKQFSNGELDTAILKKRDEIERAVLRKNDAKNTNLLRSMRHDLARLLGQKSSRVLLEQQKGGAADHA